MRKFKAHTDLVLSMCLNPHGNRLITSSKDYTIKVWSYSSKYNITHIRTFNTAKYKRHAFDSDFLTDTIFVTLNHTQSPSDRIQIWSSVSKNDTELLSLSCALEVRGLCVLNNGSFAVATEFSVIIFERQQRSSDEFPQFMRTKSFSCDGTVKGIKKLPSPDGRIVSIDHRCVMQVWNTNASRENACERRMKVKGIGMHAHRCCGPVFLDVVNSPNHGVMLVICDVNVDAVHYIGHEKILNSKKLRTRNGNGKEDIDLVEEERQWENDNSSEGSIDDSYWW